MSEVNRISADFFICKVLTPVGSSGRAMKSLLPFGAAGNRCVKKSVDKCIHPGIVAPHDVSDYRPLGAFRVHGLTKGASFGDKPLRNTPPPEQRGVHPLPRRLGSRAVKGDGNHSPQLVKHVACIETQKEEQGVEEQAGLKELQETLEGIPLEATNTVLSGRSVMIVMYKSENIFSWPRASAGSRGFTSKSHRRRHKRKKYPNGAGGDYLVGLGGRAAWHRGSISRGKC